MCRLCAFEIILSPISVMNKNTQSHSIDMMFVLLIFAGFVLTAIMLISMGTGEYRRIVARMHDNNDLRITTAYITQKIRQGKDEDAITVRNFHGVSSLCIGSEIAGTPCYTFLYVYDGKLRELLTPVAYEKDVIPASGQPLFDMESLAFEEVEDGVLMIDGMTVDGEVIRSIVTIRP